MWENVAFPPTLSRQKSAHWKLLKSDTAGICSAVKLKTLGTLFPSATCGCVLVASGKDCLVVGCCGDLSHMHMNTQSPFLCSPSLKRHRKQSCANQQCLLRCIFFCDSCTTHMEKHRWVELAGLSGFSVDVLKSVRFWWRLLTSLRVCEPTLHCCMKCVCSFCLCILKVICRPLIYLLMSEGAC